jgi:hypothetical protein
MVATLACEYSDKVYFRTENFLTRLYILVNIPTLVAIFR